MLIKDAFMRKYFRFVFVILFMGSFLMTAFTSCIAASNGKSAYEIALENGFVGSEKEWLESLKGEKGDKGDKGDAGDTGKTGAAGENAVENGIKDINIEYKWTVDGQVVICTLTMEDGTTELREYPVPKAVSNLSISESELYQPVALSGSEPTITVLAEYADGTADELTLTEGLIVEGSVDFTRAGEYSITVFYNGATLNETVYVYDPTNPRPVHIYAPPIAVLVRCGEISEEEILAFINVVFDDGSEKAVALTADMLSLEDVDVENGTYASVDVSCGGRTFLDAVTVHLISDSASASKVEYCFDETVYCAIGGECDFGYIEYFFSGGFENESVLTVPITKEMLSAEFSNTALGVESYEINVELYGQQVSGEIDVVVYNPLVNIVDIYPESNAYPKTAALGELPEGMILVVEYENHTALIPMTAEMFESVPDFTTAGEKMYRISYGDKIGREGTLRVYDIKN